MKVLAVEPIPKYPEGINATFVLIDTKLGLPRLLVDNHAPFGFHLHEGRPMRSTHYLDAMEEFIQKMREILSDENETLNNHI
jgi:hypothetical protein